MITDINQINTNTQEGKLLIAALAIITTQLHTDETPTQALGRLNAISDNIYSKAQNKIARKNRPDQ